MIVDPAKAFRMDGTSCLVTGGGSGIGRAIAVTLAAAGCSKIFLVGRRPTMLNETVALIRDAGSSCAVVAIPGDVADRDFRAGIGATIVKHGGRLDALVNNAGLFEAHALAETTDDAWQRHIDVNLTAPFALTRELLPWLKAAPKPAVVNISSTLAEKPIPNAAAYNTAKAGLVQFTRSLALELGPAGIRVNAVLPAIVETPMYRGRYEDEAAYAAGMKGAASLHPLGRVGQPSDIALATLFLVSPAASWITGVSLPVDGGMLCT